MPLLAADISGAMALRSGIGKPTILRGLGLPSLARHLHSHRLPQAVRPTPVLSGYGHARKRFRISAAKEYPHGRCKALVHSAFSSLKQRLMQRQPDHIAWTDFSTSARSWPQDLAYRSHALTTKSLLPQSLILVLLHCQVAAKCLGYNLVMFRI